MLEEQDIKQIRTVVKEEVEVVREDVRELGESIQALSSHMDEQIDGVKKDITVQIGKFRSETIDNVTRIVNNAKGDLVKEIRTERERAKLFDTKVLAVLERSKLVAPEEAVAMRELVM